MLLQETWLHEQDFINKFKNDFKDVECISANKFDLGGINAGTKIRGGIGLCYHTRFTCTVERIPTKSKCFLVQKIKIGQISLLLINVYMPCSNDNDSLDEYTNILLEISSICLANVTDFIIMGGDWNSDPSRNDGKTKLFKDFIRNENLYNALESECADVPYTWFSKDTKGNRVGSVSTIDHFIVSSSLKNLVSRYDAKFVSSNKSDHVPLLLTLDIDI